MGRYFKAQPVELNRDFIYQPPLELMMAANKFKNEELQQQGDNMQTLLDSLPFRYKDIDKENYTNIQKELNDKVKSVTEMYNKDMTSPEARKKLAELRDEIKTRYSSGDIYNIQKTNDNYDAFEKLMEDKKLSELDKERQRTYFKNFVKENPEGSLKNFFTPGNIVEDINYMPQMIKDRQSIDPTTTKTIKDRLGALGYINEHSDEYKVSFEKEFAKQWIESHPEIKSMIGTQIDSGLYNDYGNKKLEDGNLDYTKGVLGNQERYMEMFNKTDSMTSDKIGMDSTAMAKWQRQNEINDRAEAAQAEENSAFTDVGYKTKFITPEEIKANNTVWTKFLDENFRGPLKIKSKAVLNGKDVVEHFDYLKKLYKNSPKELKGLNLLINKYNNAKGLYNADRVSNNYTALARITNPEVADGIKKELDIKKGDITYFNGFKNTVILDEDNKIVSKKGQNVQDFIANNPNFKGTKPLGTYNIDNQQARYVDGSLGPLVNEGGLNNSRIEYKMRGNDGHIYRVSTSAKDVFPQFTN